VNQKIDFKNSAINATSAKRNKLIPTRRSFFLSVIRFGIDAADIIICPVNVRILFDGFMKKPADAIRLIASWLQGSEEITTSSGCTAKPFSVLIGFQILFCLLRGKPMYDTPVNYSTDIIGYKPRMLQEIGY
jgi:hypothetical protein